MTNSELLKPFAVQITVNAEQKTITGSGVITKNHAKYYIITAEHCIFGKTKEKITNVQPNNITVKWRKNNQDDFIQYPIKSIVYQDAEQDIVVLEIESNLKHELPAIHNTITDCSKAHNNIAFRGYPNFLKGEADHYAIESLENDNNRIIISSKNVKDASGEQEVEDTAFGLSGSGVFVWYNNELYLIGINSRLRHSNGTFGQIICIKLDSVFNQLNFFTKSLVMEHNQLNNNQTYFDANHNTVFNILQNRLNDALVCFDGQPAIWIEPCLSTSNDIKKQSGKKIDLNEIVSNPLNTIIHSPPEFGATCLSYYLIMEAWKQHHAFWVYINAKETKWNLPMNSVKKDLNKVNLLEANIKCVVLDSWTDKEKDSFKLLENISEKFKNVPIIIMKTIDSSQFLNELNTQEVKREFQHLHLLAISRKDIRLLVNKYNNVRNIFIDDNAILNRISNDLEVLNMHRTPFNCLTLLKVSEGTFDESPVNRTEVIKRVLFLLFNMDGVPSYKEKPDLKDCEYILGYFCEIIIKNEIKSVFTRKYFLEILKEFCDERLITIDIEVVFDTLYRNHIIIDHIDPYHYYFKHTYWIFYFAANRMQQDKEFADFIFKTKRYITFPEIIEFYTGISRDKEDALMILINDIRASKKNVRDKIGLPINMNPYNSMKWVSSPESVRKIQQEVDKTIQNSNLPDEIKDEYADKDYNSLKPYNQGITSIGKILEEYSVYFLMQNIHAVSRALRNSYFVSPKIKQELLNEITESWEELSKILFLLVPMLAVNGHASIGGADFILDNKIEGTLDEKINRLWSVLPDNIVKWFKDSLFSPKMGMLFYDNIKKQASVLQKHELILLLISGKPKEWEKYVEEYIISLPDDSYYLFNIFCYLKQNYSYSDASSLDIKHLDFLMRKSAAKHELNSRNPSKNMVNRIKITMEREVNNEDGE